MGARVCRETSRGSKRNLSCFTPNDFPRLSIFFVALHFQGSWKLWIATHCKGGPYGPVWNHCQSQACPLYEFLILIKYLGFQCNSSLFDQVGYLAVENIMICYNSEASETKIRQKILSWTIHSIANNCKSMPMWLLRRDGRTTRRWFLGISTWIQFVTFAPTQFQKKTSWRWLLHECNFA